MNISRARLFVLSPIMLALVACGGGSDSQPDNLLTTDTPSSSNNVTLTGVAIDGYLGLAKACIDINANYQCDGESEYQTLTNEQGEFSISMPESGQTKGPLLITTSVGTTIDSDHPGETINTPYFLLASADASDDTTVVSPFTTLVYSSVQEQPANLSAQAALAAAEQEIADQLKIPKAHLYRDFVEAAADTSLSQTEQTSFQQSKLLAQVLTDVMAQGFKASQENDSTSDKAKIAELFMEKFTNHAISTVQKQVESAIARGDSTSAAIAATIIEDSPSVVLSATEVSIGKIEAPLVVAAPSQGLVNDSQNTFSWAGVTDFDQPSDYQYSLDGGSSWQPVTDNLLIEVGNIDLAAGKVQVRVIKQASHDAGGILSNDIAFFQQHAGATAPTLINADDQWNIDSVTWQFTSGYDQLEQYEASFDGGSHWHAATSPLVIGNIVVASNQILIRVKASAHQDAGTALIVAQSFTQYTGPNIAAAPTQVSINDDNNSYTFGFISGFSNIGDYEYQIFNGIWQQATSTTIELADLYYGVGSIKVRVKADSSTLRPAGNILSNNSEFSVSPTAAPAPTQGLVDDSQNTFSWSPVPQFNASSDYEYRLGTSQTWQVVNTGGLFIHVGNISLAAGKVQVRVAQNLTSANTLAGAILTNTTQYTISKINVVAPTNGLVDDVNDRFSFDLVADFSDLNGYQYSTDGAISWHQVTANPIQLDDKIYNIGQVQVRVAENVTSGNNHAGAALSNAIAFTLATPNAPTGGSVDDQANSFGFNLVPTFDQLGHYQFSTDTGNTWQQVTTNPISLANLAYTVGQVQVRVAANVNSGNNAGNALSNTSAYTIALTDGPSAPTLTYLYKNNGLKWDMLDDYQALSHYQYTNDQGLTWHDVNSNPQHVGHLAYDKADVGIRVKEAANDLLVAAGDTAWATVITSTSDVFKAYSYTWRTQQRATESLTIYGSWQSSDTNCLFDHNAAIPTYWLKVSSVYTDSVDQKFNDAIENSPCGISNWQLLTPDELMLLSQTQTDTELADFSGTGNYDDKFLTKNAADEVVAIQAGVLVATPASYSSEKMLIKWQYPGVDAALVIIVPFDSTTEQQVSNDQAGYDSARAAIDILLNDYQTADAVVDYLAISSGLSASKTALDDGYDAMVTKQQLTESDYYSALLLAQFVATDPLATAAQKLSASTSMINITAALATQTDRVSQLAALQIEQEDLTQTLVDINAVLEAQTALNSSTANLTPLASSYPATLTTLAAATLGQEQHNEAMLAIEQWQLLEQQFNLASGQVTNYQALLDALPSSFHTSALAELELSRTQLESAQLPFDLVSLASDYQTIKAAFEAAYQAGYSIDLAQATIGQHFAKLDLAGHYIDSSATYSQGWRCVADLRNQGENRVWALLVNGNQGSVDQVAYSGSNGRNLTQAGGLQEQYNDQAVCGFNDWTIPTPHLLESLATVDYTSSKKTIDSSVFPHHQGAAIEDYYYWTNEVTYSDAGHKGYQYHGDEAGYYNEFTFYNDLSGYAEDEYITLGRLYRQQQQQLLDNDGNVVTDIADAYCAKDASGLIWQLPTTDDVSSRYQTVATITGLNNDGTVASDGTAAQLNASASPLCGKTNWQLPTLAQLQELNNYPLNHDIFQYWSVDDDDYNDKAYYLARDLNSSSYNLCLSVIGSDSSCRRAAYSGAPDYQYLYMMVSEPTKAAPAAPTNGVVVDTADINSFGWDNVDGFTNPTDYQYTIDGAVNWLDVSENPQALNDRNITAGDVQVRVKALPLQYLPAGGILASNIDFTSLSTCNGYENGSLCYELSTVANSHDDATAYCLADGGELVSKSSAVALSDIANGLSLDTNASYWLKEPDSYPSYAYSLKYTSWSDSWSADYGSNYTSTEQKFICVQ